MSFGADGQWVAIGWLQSEKDCRAGFSSWSWSWRCHRRPACHGVRVPVSGYAVVRDRSDREAAGRIFNWARHYLHRAAVVDLGCAAAGVLAAAQIRFGNDVARTYLALSLALPFLWLTALWLAGAYDTRFIGTGSDEFRKVLNAGVGLTAAIAIFSYAVNLQLSRGYVVIALPCVTVFDLFARYCDAQATAPAACSGQVPA